MTCKKLCHLFSHEKNCIWDLSVTFLIYVHNIFFTGSKGLPDLSESSELSSPTPEEEEEEGSQLPPSQKMGTVVVEVHGWWTTQLGYASGSEEEE